MDLNSTQVNFSFLQKPEAGPLWPSLEVAHISARSCRFSLSRAHSWAGAWEMELLLWKWAQRMRGCLTAPLPQDWRPCPQLLGILAADNTQVCLSVIIAQRHRDPSHSRLHPLWQEAILKITGLCRQKTSCPSGLHLQQLRRVI